MDEAVKKEEYEIAADLRNKITAIKTLDERLKDAISGEDFNQAQLIHNEIQKFTDFP